jgi:hypothetical protein
MKILIIKIAIIQQIKMINKHLIHFIVEIEILCI